jgi:hypothetical protein
MRDPKPSVPDPKPGDEQLRLELYKALIEESRAHREKVSALWLQKFALLGAMIAFLVTQYQFVQRTRAYSQLAFSPFLPLRCC